MRCKTVSLFTVVVTLTAVVLTLPAVAGTSTNIAWAKRDLNGDFFPDDTNTLYDLQGFVTSGDFVTRVSGVTNAEFYIQDTNDNVGIMVFFPNPVLFDIADDYPVGTSVTALDGKIGQRNGTRMIELQSEFDLSLPGSTISISPVVSTISNFLADAEGNEGTYVEIDNVGISSGNWPSLGNSSSLTITDATDSITMRIDADTDVDGQLAPTNTFDLQGIFTQFDGSAVPSNGYQVIVRAYTDIDQGLGQVPPELIVTPTGPISVGLGETATIHLLGQDRNAGDTLTFSATPIGSVADLGDREGEWTWTGAGSPGTNTVSLIVNDGTASATQQVDVILLTAILANIDLNEVLFDPSSAIDGKAGDANGDGIRDSRDDEFVEIVNRNASTNLDISGWNLIGTTPGNTNDLVTFPAGTILTAETAIVVFGGETPTGAFGNSTVLVTTNGDWALSNSGQTLRLLTDGGLQVFAENYAEMPGYDDNMNEALTRNPDLTGEFGPHSDAHAFLLWSPGTEVDGGYLAGTGVANSPPVMGFVTNRLVLPGQTVVMNVVASDPDGDTISLGVNAGAPGSFVDSGGGNGALTYTHNVADTGTVFNLTFSATDTVAQVTTALATLTVPDSALAGIIINEFLPDPNAGAIHIDSNKDGVEDGIEDEFIEVVNTTGLDVDFTGFLLSDAGGFTHVFSAASVPAGGAIVVFGGGSLDNFFDSLAQTASTGTLSLNNGGDTITLYDSGTNALDQWTYSDPGVPDAASLNRDPDVTGTTLEIHSLVGTGPASAGLRADLTPFLTNQPPIMAPISDMGSLVGSNITFDVTAQDADGHDITLFATNLPAWASYPTVTIGGGSATNTFSGAGTMAETTVVTFCASDINGTNCQDVTFIIEEPRTNFWDFETGLQQWETYNRASNRDWSRINGPANGGESSDWFMDINGFTADVASDDWLIGPAMDLTVYTDPEMTFYRWFNHDGVPTNLTFAVSTNYTGGDPVSFFTHVGDVDHDFTHATEDETWVKNTVSLSNYVGSTSVRVAFRYVTGAPFSTMHQWRIDQIRLGEPPANDPPVIDPALFNRNVIVSSNLTFSVTTTEPDGDPITIADDPVLANSTLTSNANGVATYSFTPAAPQVGAHVVSFTATDKDGADTNTITITVHGEPSGTDTDIMITEIMQNPSGVSDTFGEYFEVYNQGASGVQLNGWLIRDDGSNSNTVTSVDPVIVDGEDFLVLGRNSDTAVNGGTPVDYVYSGFFLGNSDDEVILENVSSTEIDRVEYDGGTLWPDPNGASMELDDLTLDNNVGANWSEALTSWPGNTSGDLGSPGAINDRFDRDGDGMSDNYEIEHFGDPTSGVASAFSDADPVDNLGEYIADTDPNNSNSYFRITDISVSSNVVVTFPSSSVRDYQPWYTEDIVDPNAWSNLGFAVRGAGVTNDSFTDVTNTFREYHIDVSVPE